MVSVSIAMATYNGARFLEEQIESLLSQTFRDIEIVVSDDASTDATPEILRGYADRFPQIFRLYLHEKNVGYVRNFERCLEACEGDAILLCDQDDIWESEKVEELFDALRHRGEFLIYSDAILIDDTNQTIHESLWEHLGLRNLDHNSSGLYLRNAVTGCTCILDRKLLELALPIPDGFPVHDWWLAYVALQFRKLSRLDKKLTRYRQHTGNAIGTNILVELSHKNDISSSTCTHTFVIGNYLWSKFTRPWKKNMERIHKSRIQADSFLLNIYPAFASFNRMHGLDTSISETLEKWSKAYKNNLYLKEYEPFFDNHPELFMLREDAPQLKKQVLKSMKMRQLKAIKTMVIYTLIVTATPAWLAYILLN